MSPTSYQAAPPRNLIVTIEWGSVKPWGTKDVEKTLKSIRSIYGVAKSVETESHRQVFGVKLVDFKPAVVHTFDRPPK